MSMHYMDWGIIFGLLAFMTWAAWYTKRYNRSVADFLAANRCAGRYILGVSDGIANVGAISIIMVWEMYYRGGFSVAWWALVMLVVQVIVALTGWVAYRYRQTRALTMAQFLEMRYSRGFRIYAGFIIFISGVLNFGIFPAVGARFFQYFCGIPSHVIKLHIWGFSTPLALDMSYVIIMVVLLGFALFFTFAGGQITVMVTDFIQGTMFNIALCIVIVYIMYKIPWSDIVSSLSNKPPGESMLQPFHSIKTKDFNLSYYLIQALTIFWTFMAWQGAQGYYAAARNAHEARMGRVMANWRILTQQMLVIILPIAAYALLHNAHWTALADKANAVLDTIGNNTIREQVTTSVTMRQFLPIGLMGALAAVLLAAFISTHDTYLHSWGSIFIQDVILPFRKGKRLDPKTHIRWLKYSIFGVAIFIFLFSLFFSQNSTIAMYFALTGMFWLGGAGAVIVGGLYWRRGTTAGAYAAIISATVLAVALFAAQRFWPDIYHTVKPGRVVYYTMETGSIPPGATICNTDSRFGKASLQLIPNKPVILKQTGIAGDKARTVSFWIKINHSGTVISWGKKQPGKAWIIKVVSKMVTEKGQSIVTHVPQVDVYGGTITGETNIADESWHHIAVLLDPSRGSNVANIEIWVDGNLQTHTEVKNGSLHVDTAAGTPIVLGGTIDKQSSAMELLGDSMTGKKASVATSLATPVKKQIKKQKSYIDELSIYNRAVNRKLLIKSKNGTITVTPPTASGRYEMDILKGLNFPINSQWGQLIAMAVTLLFYILVSLVTCRKPFNLDKMLHRGKYAIASDQTEIKTEPVRGLGALIGMGKDFNLKDKIVYSSITGWSVLWAVVFIGGCIYNYFINKNVPESTWAKFWEFYIWLSVVLGVITTIWFTIGGIADVKKLFRKLGTMSRNEKDDGTVASGHNLADETDTQENLDVKTDMDK